MEKNDIPSHPKLMKIDPYLPRFYLLHLISSFFSIHAPPGFGFQKWKIRICVDRIPILPSPSMPPPPRTFLQDTETPALQVDPAPPLRTSRQPDSQRPTNAVQSARTWRRASTWPLRRGRWRKALSFKHRSELIKSNSTAPFREFVFDGGLKKKHGLPIFRLGFAGQSRWLKIESCWGLTSLRYNYIK